MSHWRIGMNIGDIAKMAGVSRAAVSRYLNDGYISEEKKERIRNVIEETGYKPSIMAQTLRTKKTKLIGVVLPRIDSDSISSIVQGISQELSKSGYDLLLATTDNSPEKELEYFQIFSKNRVDGLILIATVLTKEHQKILRKMPIPCVIVGQSFDGGSCIYHDDYEAGKQLTDLLLKKRRKIGYIGVLKEDVAVGTRRWEGWRDAMEEAGIPVRPEMSVTGDFSSSSGYRKMEELLKQCPDLDGVVCATDRIAVGALQYLKKIGKRVPGDISLAGFGDNRISAVTEPPVTTVHFHYKESGERAAETMLSRLEEPKAATVAIKLGFEIIERGSV